MAIIPIVFGGFGSTIRRVRMLDYGGGQLGVPIFPQPAPLYAGPGDIVSGALAWGGLRAYSLAAIGSNAVRLRRDSDNAESDFITLASGALDVASISSFKGAANLFITTLYDQTGNGNDVTQATAASQPAFTLSGLGTLPIITFDGVNDFLRHTTSGSMQFLTISAVANHTTSGVQQSLWYDGAGIQVGYRNTANNQVFLFGGGVLAATASDGSWHALQAVLNGASSDNNVDGISTTGDVGGPSIPEAGNDEIGSAGGGQFLTGSLVEVGRWTTIFTGAQSSNMSSNQRAYWGF